MFLYLPPLFEVLERYHHCEIFVSPLCRLSHILHSYRTSKRCTANLKQEHSLVRCCYPISYFKLSTMCGEVQVLQLCSVSQHRVFGKFSNTHAYLATCLEISPMPTKPPSSLLLASAPDPGQIDTMALDLLTSPMSANRESR
jgi:hypothetical protein